MPSIEKTGCRPLNSLINLFSKDEGPSVVEEEPEEVEGSGYVPAAFGELPEAAKTVRDMKEHEKRNR